MKFSSGQVAFIIFFLILFIAAIAWSMLRDKKINSKHYKGVRWILLVFIIVMAGLSFLLRLSGKF